jgi:hypothetical protein
MHEKIEWKLPNKLTRAERAELVRTSVLVGTACCTIMVILPQAIATGTSQHSVVRGLMELMKMTGGTLLLFTVTMNCITGLISLYAPKCSILDDGVRARGELWRWSHITAYNIAPSKAEGREMNINFCHSRYGRWVSVPFLSGEVDEDALREAIERYLPYMDLPEDNPSPFKPPDPTRQEVLKSIKHTAIWSLVSGCGAFWFAVHSAVNGSYPFIEVMCGFTFIGAILLFGFDLVRCFRLLRQQT